jgi:DUF1365 family protein
MTTRRSALYTGTIVHARRDVHAQRTFRYPLYVAAIDLDELSTLDRELRLFSYNKRNLFALSDRDFHDGRGAIAASHADLLAANGIATPAAIRLVTNLRVAGYVFNPVSFFLGYGANGALTSVVAEVNNTYGGRFRYVLGPRERLPDRDGRVGFRHTRELFVSPFLHGEATYDFWFDAPVDGEELAVTMHVDCAGERVFTAHLAGTRTPLTDGALARVAVRYPFMTAQVIGLIHYEALKLHLRRVPFLRPRPGHRPITWPDSVVSRAPGVGSIQ